MKTKTTKSAKTTTKTAAITEEKSVKTAKTKTAPKKACATKKASCAKKASKAPAKTTAPSAPATKLTRIVAHINVGWGRMLYIRGEGAGLSWEQGIPMLCENDTEWHWIAETDEAPISFKFLIDDEIWALGENITINAGDIHISEPRF